MSSLLPPRFLRGADLAAVAPEGLVVTIDRALFIPARSRYKGDPGTFPALKLREIRQPWIINGVVDPMLEKLLGRDASRWSGRVIRIVPVEVEVRGEEGPLMVWVVNPAAELPTTPPTLPQNVDLWEAAERARNPPAPPPAPQESLEDPAPLLGLEAAAAAVEVLHAHGQSWDAFLRHLGAKAPQLFDRCIGVLPPECPALAGEWARTFAGMFPRTGPVGSAATRRTIAEGWAAPLPPTGEIRGQFLTVHRTPAATASAEIREARRPAPAPGRYEPGVDDIPF